MVMIHFYTKKACLLCDEAKLMLEFFQDEYDFNVRECDIYTNDLWLEKYQLLIPCVKVNNAILDASQLNWETLRNFLDQYVGNKR
ncbi:hypothetical protein A21D_00111 [Virgibacillus dokdonensis]|uniref:Glutaredoxin family protein n=1 Tax=Virgibacillus dokdonensis TaxID=302167 RepID=A0A2K9ITZ4_9BACI|nr:hypothetical protein A21D_00111 [Virgibacillus dokdonensis]NWO14778.1 glutaredoxin family protein [Virgibacillus sp.]